MRAGRMVSAEDIASNRQDVAWHLSQLRRSPDRSGQPLHQHPYKSTVFKDSSFFRFGGQLMRKLHKL